VAARDNVALGIGGLCRSSAGRRHHPPAARREPRDRLWVIACASIGVLLGLALDLRSD